MDAVSALPARRVLSAYGDAHTITPLVAQQDSLRRELREAQTEIQRLKHMYDTQTNKNDHLATELLQAKKAAAAGAAQTDKLAREVQQARQARAEADANLSANNEYVKKLESKVVNGKQGHFLLEQNAKLRAALVTMKQEADTNKAHLDEARSSLEKATREIEVLATALEMRADELALGGDLRSGLLYEVAHRREEVKRLREEATTNTVASTALEATVREVRAQLARSQHDVASLAERATSLSAQVDMEQATKSQLQEMIRSVEQERDHSLQFVSEHSKKLAEAILRAESSERRNEELSRAVSELQASKTAAETRVARIKDVQDITNATLQQERAAATEATSRAQKAESEASVCKHEAASMKQQMNALIASHQEQQVSLAARSQEVLSLQAQVRQLSSELSDISSRYMTLQKVNSETTANGEIENGKLKHQLDSLKREKETAVVSARDANARATVLMVENGRLSSMLSTATTEIADMKAAKSTIAATTAAQIASLRDQLVAEQSAHHTAQLAQLALEEEREREMAEKARLQRLHDAERANPRGGGGGSGGYTTNNDIYNNNTASTSYSSPHRWVTPGTATTSQIVATHQHEATIAPSSSSSSQQQQQQQHHFTSRGADPMAMHTAALVRDTLRSAGMDPGLAEEYLASVTHSGANAITTASGSSNSTAGTSSNRPVLINPPRATYGAMDLPSGPAQWTGSLRSPSTQHRSGHHHHSDTNTGGNNTPPSSLSSSASAAARRSAALPPSSPGAIALQEATALYRSRKNQQQQQQQQRATLATTGENRQSSGSTVANSSSSLAAAASSSVSSKLLMKNVAVVHNNGTSSSASSLSSSTTSHSKVVHKQEVQEAQPAVHPATQHYTETIMPATRAHELATTVPLISADDLAAAYDDVVVFPDTNNYGSK